jgi:hypothetical protein
MRVVGESAGWFADPAGRFRFRYWDGGQWTDQVLSGTTREEATDALEPALRVQPPRPVLPTLPAATSNGGARLLDAPPPKFGTGQRTLRLPRPTPAFFAAVLLVCLLVGVLVWLVGKVADDGSNGTALPPPISVATFGSPQPPVPVAGLVFFADTDLAGYERTTLAKAGISVALPGSWHAFAPDLPANLAQLKQQGESPSFLAEAAQTRLYADDGPDRSVVLTIRNSTVDPSILDEPRAVVDILRSTPEVIAADVAVTKTRIGGMRAVQAVVPFAPDPANGVARAGRITDYFVRTPKGLVVIQFLTTTQTTDDPSIAVIMAHVEKAD